MSTQLVKMKARQSGAGSIKFEWIGSHSVWIFDDKAAFESCDFDRGQLLALSSGYVFKSNAGTYYFGCMLKDHCSAGQKLQLVIEDNTDRTGFVSRASARTRISLVQSECLGRLNQCFFAMRSVFYGLMLVPS